LRKLSKLNCPTYSSTLVTRSSFFSINIVGLYNYLINSTLASVLNSIPNFQLFTIFDTVTMLLYRVVLCQYFTLVEVEVFYNWF